MVNTFQTPQVERSREKTGGAYASGVIIDMGNLTPDFLYSFSVYQLHVQPCTHVWSISGLNATN